MLAQSHSAELRMLARTVQIGRGQTQRSETAKTLSPQLAERIQQLGEALAPRCLELSEPIERGKRHAFPMREKMVRARHPVCTFSVNQMTDDVIGAPRAWTLRPRYPGRWEIAEQDIQDFRGPRQHRHGGVQVEIQCGHS